MHTTNLSGGAGRSATDVRNALALDAGQWARARAGGIIPEPDLSSRRWSAAVVQRLVEDRDRIVRQVGDLADVHQLATVVGWEPAEVFRAVTAGLVTGPDTGRFWSQSTVEKIAATADKVRPLIPTQPLGAARCAEILTGLSGHPVTAVDVADLAAHGYLTAVDHFAGRPLYRVEQVEALAATDTGRALIAAHHHLGPDQAATHLGIRRTDFDHLVNRGWLTPSTHVQGRRAQTIALYRRSDLDHLTTKPGLDWPALRNTHPGQRTPVPTTDHPLSSEVPE